jgi:hypothetical protein
MPAHRVFDGRQAATDTFAPLQQRQAFGGRRSVAPLQQRTRRQPLPDY